MRGLKMRIKKKEIKKKQNSDQLLRFLTLTKEGKYAQIEKSSLKYTRLKEERADIDICEEQYYYGLS